jgi:hypothetical protein
VSPACCRNQARLAIEDEYVSPLSGVVQFKSDPVGLPQNGTLNLVRRYESAFCSVKQAVCKVPMSGKHLSLKIRREIDFKGEIFPYQPLVRGATTAP